MRLVKPDHTTISYPCLREHPHTCCILVLSRSSSQDPNRPCWYPQASFPAGHPTVSKTPPFQKRESMLQLTFRNSNHQEWLRHWAEASTCNFITVFQWENVTCILPKSSPPQATPHSPRYSDCKSHPKGPPCRAPHSPEDEVFSKDVSFWRFFTDCQCQYLPTSVDHQTKDNKSAPSVASFPLPVRSLRHGGLRQWRSRSCLGLPAWLCGDASASNRTASNPHKPDWIYCNSNSLKKNIQNSNIYIYIYQFHRCLHTSTGFAQASGKQQLAIDEGWQSEIPAKKHNSSWHSANATVFTSIFDNPHNALRPSCDWCTRPS